MGFLNHTPRVKKLNQDRVKIHPPCKKIVSISIRANANFVCDPNRLTSWERSGTKFDQDLVGYIVPPQDGLEASQIQLAGNPFGRMHFEIPFPRRLEHPQEPVKER